MPLIAQPELEELKRGADLVALVRSKGIRLEKHGKDLKGLCPFHADQSPSLIVSPAKNLFHCPACGAGGDAIAFLRRFDGVSFRHAVELLRAGKASGALSSGGGPVKQSTVPRLAAPVVPSADDARQLRAVVDYYHQRLLETTPAQDYLRKRGLFFPECIREFQLGFADRTLGLRLPESNRKEGAALRGQLQRLGIYRETGHEHFNGCLVMPVLDAEGVVTELYGRRLDDSNERRGAPRHLYLPGPHRGMWNPACLRHPFLPAGLSVATPPERTLILCEALLDALTFYAYGFPNVTASYGVAGFTDDHLAALISHRIAAVYIAYDRDAAGSRAAAALAAKLQGEGIRAYAVLFPPETDVNAHAVEVLARHHGDAEAVHLELARLLRAAQWLEVGPAIQAVPRRARSAIEAVPRRAEDDVVSEASCAAASANATLFPLAAEPVPAAESALAEGSALSAPPEPPFERVRDQVTLEKQAGQNPLVAEGAVILPKPSSPAHFAPPGCCPKGNVATATLQGVSGDGRSHPLTVPCRVTGEDVEISLGERSWRVRGLGRNQAFDVMKVNLRVAAAELFHVDTLDLYNARHRTGFIHAAALELRVDEEVLRRDVGRVLLKLEELQEEQIARALEPEKKNVPEMDDAARTAALALLRAPDLLERIAADFELTGLAGERKNALAAYLAAVSRKTTDPLAVIIQSSSSAGKSSLLDAVLAFMPEEETVRYTAMTGQSLFYMGETSLAHKILAISEEEGAEQAGYALKILQSEKRLRIASTGKDPKSGRLVTQEYHVEGPAAIMLTTTALDIDEELQNRCLVLTVNEERDQTRRIHHLQRQSRTLDGLLRREERARILALHRNAQRLLKPLHVVNPHAASLTFADGRLRTRRDHVKYLNLIGAIALLRQHQKPLKSATHGGQRLDYIEVEVADIAAANRLTAEIMGTSLDELPPQTRKLLIIIHDLASATQATGDRDWASLRLTRRAIREQAGWSNTQLGVHLERLVEMEFLFLHRGKGRQQLYEPGWRGEGLDGQRFLLHLADPAAWPPAPAATHAYDAACTVPNPPCTPHLRPESGASPPHLRPDFFAATASPLAACDVTSPKPPEKHLYPLAQTHAQPVVPTGEPMDTLCKGFSPEPPS